MYTMRLCSLVGLLLIQTGLCFPDHGRSKRQAHDEHAHMDERFTEVLGKLAEMGDAAASNHEVLEHIHQHVEHVAEKVGQNWELLVELRNRQKWLALCRADGNPCANGGSCTFNEETDNYACACPFGWQGLNCEEVFDPCADVECQNYGSCVNGTCTCPEEFLGEHCEIGACAQALDEYNAMEFPMPGMERPRCYSDGTYASYQYRGTQAICATRGGVYLTEYSLDRWDPNHESMTCKCAILRYEFLRDGKEHLLENFQCSPDGSFHILGAELQY